MPSHGERGRSEASRKQHDVEFERRLQLVRDDANPDTRRSRLAADIIEASPLNPTGQIALAYLPAEDREAVRALVSPHYAALDGHRDARQPRRVPRVPGRRSHGPGDGRAPGPRRVGDGRFFARLK